MDHYALGDAVDRAADDAGDVRPVAVTVSAVRRARIAVVVADVVRIAIVIVIDVVAGDRRAPAELLMRRANPGIDDMHMHDARSTRVGVHRIQWKRTLVEAIQSPRRARLHVRHVHHAVLLDVEHTRIARENGSGAGAHLHGKAAHRTPIDMLQAPLMGRGDLASDNVAVGIRGERDDVLIGNGARHAPHGVRTILPL